MSEKFTKEFDFKKAAEYYSAQCQYDSMRGLFLPPPESELKGFYVNADNQDNNSNLTMDKWLELKKTVQPVIRIHICEYLPNEYVQARRHKRKSSRRWQKKWRKRFGEKKITKAIRLGNDIFMPKEMYDAVIAKTQKSMIETTERITREAFFFGRW
jgi:hypothetical protein